MKKFILEIGLIIIGLGLILGGILYIKNLKDNILGLGVITDFSTTLSSSISSSANSLSLTSITDRAGNSITFTSSTFGDAAYFNIEPGTSRSEIVRCTGLSGSTFNGCSRGLPFGANGCNNTASTTLQQAHNQGSRVVMSNVCQIYNDLVAKDVPQIMRGLLTVQYGGITLGDGNTTTTNSNGILIARGGSQNPSWRYNGSGNYWEFSDDGTSFTRPMSTTSVADAGLGIIRSSISGTPTSTVYDVATGTRSGLEFYNLITGPPFHGNMRVAVSSTQGLWIDNSLGGLLAVTSTWFVGASNQGGGLLGFASTSFIIDADNTGTMSALNGIIFETGTSNGGADKRLFVDPNDSFLLKYEDYPSGANRVTVAGGPNTSSTQARSYNAGQTTIPDSATGAENITVNHNLGIIPAWIKITAFPSAGGTTGNTVGAAASSTYSYGVWINGAAPTITPGANSSTYSQANGHARGFATQSASTTIRLLNPLPGSCSTCLIDGIVDTVTSSTFRINKRSGVTDSTSGGLGTIYIFWEAGQ